MVDAWPAGLPQHVLVDGYNEGEAKTNISTQPDIGPPITRTRTTAGPRPLAFSLLLTGADLGTLLTFYRTTLANGALPFTFPAPRGGETYLVKFQEDGAPNVTSAGGDNYNVAMKVWILP